MDPQQEGGAHLFLVRFRSRGPSQGHASQDSQRDTMFSGRVQHVLTGEARNFDHWPTLIDLLLEMAETERIETNEQRATRQEIIP